MQIGGEPERNPALLGLPRVDRVGAPSRRTATFFSSEVRWPDRDAHAVHTGLHRDGLGRLEAARREAVVDVHGHVLAVGVQLEATHALHLQGAARLALCPRLHVGLAVGLQHLLHLRAGETRSLRHFEDAHGEDEAVALGCRDPTSTFSQPAAFPTAEKQAASCASHLEVSSP